MTAEKSAVCDFDWKAPDFELPGVDGKRYRLTDIQGENGTVVMFICNHCPYVKAVIDRIVRDCGELVDRGVASIAVMSNDTAAYPADSFDRMTEFAAEHRFGFPYVIDETQDVARAYDAVCTPDFFGFNKHLELQYRGRLDESGRAPSATDARRELYEAMAGVAETGEGPAEQTASIGCSIKWRK